MCHRQLCLGSGSRATGARGCGCSECCLAVRRRVWALRHLTVALRICPIGEGQMGAGTSKVGDPGQLPFLPESKGRTKEELPNMVIVSKDPETLRAIHRGYLRRHCCGQQNMCRALEEEQAQQVPEASRRPEWLGWHQCG